MLDWIRKIGQETVFVLASTILFVLVFIRLVLRTSVEQSETERVTVGLQTPWFYLCLGLLCGLIFFLYPFLEKIPAKMVFTTGTVCYLLFGGWLIRSAPALIRADADYTLLAVRQINQGDYSSLAIENGYLAQYPHQLGLVSFERLFTWLGSGPYQYFVVNLLLVLLANWCLWQSLEQIIAEKRKTINLALILSFLFLAPFFYILFVYGLVPGYAFLSLSVWCLCKAQVASRQTEFTLREKTSQSPRLTQPFNKLPLVGKLWVFAGILAAAFALATRNNNSIALIALAGISILLACQQKKKILIVLSLLFLVLIPGVNQVNLKWYSWEAGHELNPGIPKIAWVNMGLQESGRGAGWFNSYNTKLFKKYGFDPKKASSQANKDLKTRIQELKKDPVYTFRFFARKVNSTWNEPTYQSIWSGPLADLGQTMSSRFWNSLYSGGKLLQVYQLFLAGLSSLIYLGAALFPWTSRGRLTESSRILYCFGHLYFLGGFLFHFIWETKSQYGFPYVFFLIPAAAFTISQLVQQLGQKIGWSKYSANHNCAIQIVAKA